MLSMPDSISVESTQERDVYLVVAPFVGIAVPPRNRGLRESPSESRALRKVPVYPAAHLLQFVKDGSERPQEIGALQFDIQLESEAIKRPFALAEFEPVPVPLRP